MNGINSFRLNIDTAKYQASISNPKKVAAITELKTATESNKKRHYQTDLNNNTLNSNKDKNSARPIIILSEAKYSRANLLNEIVNKMSGLENREKPGQYVEYYA